MTSYESIIDLLAERRLVPAAAMIREDFRIEDVSRRNCNLRVEFDGQKGYFVKVGMDLDRNGTLNQEAVNYRFLHSVLEPSLSKSLLAPFRLFDEQYSVLVLDLMPGENLRALCTRRGRFVPELFRYLGRELGSLHRQVWDAGKVPDGCGVFYPLPFHLDRPTNTFLQSSSAASLDLIRIVQSSNSICSGLEGLSTRWKTCISSGSSFIHGDVRLENCCVTSKPATLRLVDWELAARGDFCWDTGSVLADLISLWLMSVPMPTGANPAECLPFAALKLHSLKDAANAFWSAYAVARALEGPGREAAFRATVLYAAARLIQLAYEHLQGFSKLTTHAVSHLQLSENLFVRPVDGAAQLLGIPA